jgi:hypothetical protein
MLRFRVVDAQPTSIKDFYKAPNCLTLRNVSRATGGIVCQVKCFLMLPTEAPFGSLAHAEYVRTECLEQLYEPDLRVINCRKIFQATKS